MTVGEKIRRIRTFRGLTQAQLGNMVGLSGDRIRQYENDVRKPKPDLLQKIVTALNVDSSALADIDITSFDEVMHTLFLLEDELGLTIDRIDNHYTLMFENNPPNKNILYALDSWYTAKQKSRPLETDTAESAAEKDTTYRNWRYRYPLDNHAQNKSILDNFNAMYKHLLQQPSDIIIHTFKDAALILEKLLHDDIQIELTYSSDMLPNSAFLLVSFDYAELMNLSNSTKKDFINFLDMLQQLSSKNIVIKNDTFTYLGHAVIDFKIYNAQLYSLGKDFLLELQKRIINNTYAEDPYFNDRYKNLLNTFDVPIENLL
jgi:transcriptional regulator with XRE-family HTH domain